jgi:hypothetical protein
MKIPVATILLLVTMAISVLADTLTNPLADFAAQFELTSADQVKKIEVDINGDGRLDIMLSYAEPGSNIEERRVIATGDKRLWWTSYTKNQDGTYTKTTGIDIGEGGIDLGTDIAFDPVEVYIGQVVEVSRFAVVVREKQTPRRANATSIIWAFTWEGGHFKRHKLSEFVTGTQNALFDKYLIEGKRTVLLLQHVTP